jgi:hypothetical protein
MEQVCGIVEKTPMLIPVQKEFYQIMLRERTAWSGFSPGRRTPSGRKREWKCRGLGSETASSNIVIIQFRLMGAYTNMFVLS